MSDEAGASGSREGLRERVDLWQQRNTVAGFLVAVSKKFGDDRAGRLAALVAYYSFFSLFPLLLVAATVIGFIVESEGTDVLSDTALDQIPVIGREIGSQVGGYSGSPIALTIGIVTSLWAGLGCMQALQDAMNEVWDIPRVDQPSFLKKRLRSIATLAIVGLSLLVAAFATQAIALVPGLSSWGRLVGHVVTLFLDIGVFLLVFEVATARRQTWSVLLPGAVVAGCAYWLLQLAGRLYVEVTVSGASDTYGTFAVVIGLLSWLYLLGQLILVAAEINVVRARRLWPRAIRIDHPTTADIEAARAAAQAVRQRKGMTIDVEWEPTRDAHPGDPTGSSVENDT